MNEPLPRPSLLAGSAHFQVIEEPAYVASGTGEHLYVEIEKEGLTTDAVAERLAQALGVKAMNVGYAGRKDRHAITRQWFSILTRDQTRLATLADETPGRRVSVLQVTRHGNKLRLGHLAGNRFRLAIGGVSDAAALANRLERMCREGIRNAFGSQRFGINGATLAMARAWGAGDAAQAVSWIIDPKGGWRFGDELPSGFRPGPDGRVLGALRRRPNDAAGALRAAGDTLLKLASSAAQSAIFNDVLKAREAAGLLHRLRVGDLGCTSRGAPFLVTQEELDTTNQRCQPGVLDAFATGPLPGTRRLAPLPAIEEEERVWSAATAIDWAWLGSGGLLESPGERRSLVVPFRTAPTLSGGSPHWLEFSLPSGVYATEVLEQAGIAIPTDRRG